MNPGDEAGVQGIGHGVKRDERDGERRQRTDDSFVMRYSLLVIMTLCPMLYTSAVLFQRSEGFR